ncbi:hypothetical protein [Actomonas aquatica]|uniref:Uncharacterized protein n=1 Tax=Actomonas aquatica TaxID=2866162 RepID=A0ABZ1C1Y7_9BACT|nr:hypothetical protein [Opitutus sp. WL0086]WRQ85649.1 hypothetical protein K1X11_012625 [Opitutus sp. WL0086]
MSDSTPPPTTPAPHASWSMTEERFSLADLLTEVSIERVSGALGMQKLKQDEIHRLFRQDQPATPSNDAQD